MSFQNLFYTNGSVLERELTAGLAFNSFRKISTVQADPFHVAEMALTAPTLADFGGGRGVLPQLSQKS
jgi:hypothetical protein